METAARGLGAYQEALARLLVNAELRTVHARDPGGLGESLPDLELDAEQRAALRAISPSQLKRAALGLELKRLRAVTATVPHSARLWPDLGDRYLDCLRSEPARVDDLDTTLGPGPSEVLRCLPRLHAALRHDALPPPWTSDLLALELARACSRNDRRPRKLRCRYLVHEALAALDEGWVGVELAPADCEYLVEAERLRWRALEPASPDRGARVTASSLAGPCEAHTRPLSEKRARGRERPRATTRTWLGAGFGLRRPHLAALAARRAEGDLRPPVLELTPSHFFAQPELLDELAANHTIVLHDVYASLATVGPIDRRHLERVAAIARRCGAVDYSEHLASTRSPRGLDLGHLIPVARTHAQLAVLVDHIHAAQDLLALPVAIELPATTIALPGAELDEAEFVTRLVDRSGCELHLDLENLRVDALNERSLSPPPHRERAGLLGARGAMPRAASLGLFAQGFVAKTCSGPTTAAFWLRALDENSGARRHDALHHGLLGPALADAGLPPLLAESIAHRLAGLPLDAVTRIHLAGGHVDPGGWAVDSHRAPVSDHTYAILSALRGHLCPRAIIIERDDRLPPLAELIDEAERAERVWQGA